MHVTWSEYNTNLKQRGSITFWLCDNLKDIWYPSQKVRGMGKTKIYSEKAIEICLTLRAVFRLPLRQTQGFVESLLEMAGFDLKAPDYSTLCRRSKDFDVVLREFSANEPIEIAVDGTGLKVFGEGEWKVRTHKAGKRRTWRKLHIGVNTATLEIVAAVATEADTADSEVVEDLLAQIDEPISKFLGDGAYDTNACYESCEKRDIEVVVPPRKNAVFNLENAYERNLNVVEMSQCEDRKAWKVKRGYHKRSLAETAMYCLKTIFGDNLRSSLFETQATEMLLRCQAYNRMRKLDIDAAVNI